MERGGGQYATRPVQDTRESPELTGRFAGKNHYTPTPTLSLEAPSRHVHAFSKSDRQPRVTLTPAAGPPYLESRSRRSPQFRGAGSVNLAAESPAQAFIARWKKSEAAEQANSQLFLRELCDLLELPAPDPTVQDDDQNTYVFEKRVVFQNGDGTTSAGRIDLYRAGCFVLESKQGSEAKEDAALLSTVAKNKKHRTGTASRGAAGWQQAMTRARNQAERYAKALPVSAGWPPFLVVVDVGHCFDLYADFSQSGKAYVPFPDPQNYRIRLDDLADPAVREKLRALWLEPLTLDPSRRAAKVTRELAGRLAQLAKSLEGAHPPEVVANFLIRSLFTMFSEDVELLPPGSFAELLVSLRGDTANFVPMVENLWANMNTGGFSPILRQKLLRFNGGLFADCTALPLNDDQLELLIEAAQSHWTDVEPAIFGTLLERALDPVERHKLGAHYTPRAYVERLVMPTIIDPLRNEWRSVYASAVQLDSVGKAEAARQAVRDFHHHLCEVRVLDPACGSGNFLYVTLEHMKRLEGEVLNTLREFGEKQLPLLTIDPHQFLGIEVNPRAAAITDLVLWIGYLQWHFRTRGKAELPEPILRDYHNIECRDAVLAWDAVEDVRDEQGQPVTRWDGRTTKPHPVTGEEVPDETARVIEQRYKNPRKADWPKCDFIVGNPPFIGNKRMISSLGAEYSVTLRNVHDEVPESADYVMYWWDMAARSCLRGAINRFGFITTNSITQVFNRRVLEPHLAAEEPLSIIFAVPDHPWIDATDGAGVRIAMTVGELGNRNGQLSRAVDEKPATEDQFDVVFEKRVGKINADLSVDIDLRSVAPLKSNEGLCGQGMKLVGEGFVLEKEIDRDVPNTATGFPVVRRYISPRDILDGKPGRHVIDFCGLSEAESRRIHPAAFQILLDRVKPLRDQNRRESIRKLWWRFAWERPVLREAMNGLARYVVTLETSKHRFFVAVEPDYLWDGSLFAIALDDFYYLGVLSSKAHVTWALRFGARLEDRPRWNNGSCFDPFPFPDCSESQKQRIRELGEQLDGHRKARQALFPGLTMTGMYNVLEKLRAGEALSKKEVEIHEQGLVSVLRQLHDELDAAVAAAYGWPADLSDEEILQRLVELNALRAAEEARGVVRWLRPDFQNPQGQAAAQKEIAVEVEAAPAAKSKAAKQPWPATLPERFQAVRTLLEQLPAPATPEEVAARFTRARRNDVSELLETLTLIGQARQLDDGRYAA